ncbi:MAG: hypothetical protein ACM336_15890 [Acidobacteriota bacterium]
MRFSTILFFISIAAATAAEPALAPVRVCQILEEPAKYAGQTALVLGRFSFREQGRFLSERACEARVGWPGVLRVVADSKTGPVPPGPLAVESTLLDRKLAEMKRSTTLANFRFGSTDYDRWALIYGRVELSPAYADGPAKDARKTEFDPAPGRIVCREALIVFIGER